MCSQLIIEGLAISGSLLIVFAIIHIAMMGLIPTFAMEHGGIFGAVFLAGILTHFLLEFSGANAKYCKNKL